MSPIPRTPLNEPQQRHITVTLAALEKALAELRRRLEQQPRDLRLVQFSDPLGDNEAAALLPLVANAESRLRRIADQLQLKAHSEPVRRSLIAGLELAGIHLYECTPPGGLAGYGSVAPATAEYLGHELPQLELVIRSLVKQLVEPRRATDGGSP